MTEPRHTARGIVVHDGQILLMERWRDGQHYFSIPGGGIEPGEKPEDTAQREILEETTIRVKVVRLCAEMQAGDFRHYIFICEYFSGEPGLPPDSEEARTSGPENRFNPCWQPLKSFSELYLRYWEPLKPFIAEGLKNGFPDKPGIIKTA